MFHNGDNPKALSAQPQAVADGSFEFVFLVPQTEKMSDFDSHVFEVSYDLAWMFAMNLIGQLQRTADVRMRNAVAGDCETCGNYRMVEVIKKVRPELVRCPDCGEAYSNAKPAYPTQTPNDAKAAKAAKAVSGADS